MDAQGITDQVAVWLDQGFGLAQGWLLSPAAWSQFAALLGAWGLATLIARRARPRLARLLTPPEGATSLVAQGRRFLLPVLPLILPLLAWALTAAGEQVTRSLFGAGAVIALGKNVFLFLAARVLVHEVLTDSFLRFLGRFVLVPLAALNVLGLLGPLTDFLNGFVVQTGNISFSAMTLVRGVIAGSLLFWLGTWSNSHTASYIGRQPMRPAIRQLSLKAAEIAIFGLAFLMLLNVMGISVSSLTILGGAVGVGLGFGLQKIASNFASGVILLIEGQTTVGDRVRLDGGEEGRIIKMTARATVLETEDGSWIMVPNEDFITTRVINYSDASPQLRHEAGFAVPYGTDLARVPPIVTAALATHPEVLSGAPHGPGCELRAFAEGGVRFVAEFWVEGEREGTHYTSDALFLIWGALQREGIDVVGTAA